MAQVWTLVWYFVIITSSAECTETGSTPTETSIPLNRATTTSPPTQEPVSVGGTTQEGATICNTDTNNKNRTGCGNNDFSDTPSTDVFSNSTITTEGTLCQSETNTTKVFVPCGAPDVKPIPSLDQGILSKSQYETGEVACRILVYILILSAVCVNIINIIVYTDSSMKSPTSTYLIALSASELLYAVLSTIMPILKVVYGSKALQSQVYLLFVLYNGNYILGTLRRLMFCLTVLVSMERFLAVTFPLKARNFRLIKSPTVCIIATSVFCFIMHLPHALKFNVVPKPNSSDYTLSPSFLYLHNKQFVLNVQMANRIIFVYILLAACLIVNLLMLMALKMHTKNRQKMKTSVDEGKAARKERQKTVVILSSTFLFTLLALPLATDTLVKLYLPHYNLYQREHYMYVLMKDVITFLTAFSLSTDFLFYVILSRAYRRTFFKRIPFMAAVFRRKTVRETSAGEETKLSVISGVVTNNV